MTVNDRQEPKPTVRQLRAWQRRAEALEHNASALMSDMLEAVSLEYAAAGENFTSQADDVAASAQNLVNYLDTCIRVTKRSAH